MTDSTVPAGTDPGLFSRAAGIVFSPADTYAHVVRRPSAVGILFIACLLIGLAAGLPQLTERGRMATLDVQVQQIERFTGQPVTPEMYEQLERQAGFGVYTAFIGTFVMLPVTTVVISGVIWVVFSTILGGTATFKGVLAVVAHSQIIPAIGAVAAAPIQYVRGIESMAGPFNLGALAPMLDPRSFLASFLSAVSVFTIWQIVVAGIGLGVLYARPAKRIITGLLIAFLALVAVITGVISSFMGQ